MIVVAEKYKPADDASSSQRPAEPIARQADEMLSEIGPLFLTSKARGGYASLLVCFFEPKSPELALFDRGDIDIISFDEFASRIKEAGGDPDLFLEAMELAYLFSYEMTLMAIRSAIEGEFSSYLMDLPDCSKGPVVVEGAHDLLFGLVEPPSSKYSSAGLDGIRVQHSGMGFQKLMRAYPDYRTRDNRFLAEFQNAWTEAAKRLPAVYWERFPDKPVEASMITCTEIIEAMCLEHAKEAIEAGVPVADVIC